MLAAIATLAAPALRAAEVARWFRTSDGVRLRYLDAGSGRVVVFVPGWCMPASIFEPQIAALSRRWRVVSLDPRGQGESEVPQGGYDPARRGQDIRDLLAHLGGGRVVLAGWSLGVLDTLSYADMAGDGRLAGLVLIDNSVGEGRAPPPRSTPSRFFINLRQRRDQTVRGFVRSMYRTPQDAAYLDAISRQAQRMPVEASIRLLSYPRPREFWKQSLYAVRRPVYYAVTPRLRDQANEVAQNHPQPMVEVFDGAGHALFVDEAARFNASMEEFLSRRAGLGLMQSLIPLFLIAGAAVGVEIALTRFFAVASWSEYGYWVISIAMTGFAVSGVVMVLGRGVFLRHARWLLPALPIAMLAVGGAGWIGATLNGFNPLELQNPVSAEAQLWNIALYYAALFPFFFLAGLAVSLNFVVHADQVGRVYGYDLLGAGTGAVLALLLMFVLHPFALVPALLPLLAVAAMISGGVRWRIAAVLVLAGTEAAVFGLAAPRVNEFKAIYAPLNVPDSRVVAEILSPRGVYRLLDNFTERLDTDVSNNAGALGVAAPPRSFGLYRDGSRIAALPNGPPEAPHARAALDGAPYALLDSPRVLVLGGAGGFRAAEALALGAAHVTVIEPEPVLRNALLHGLGPSPASAAEPRVTVSAAHPLTATGRYDLVDIAGDFLGADEQNRNVYTAEALAGFFDRLPPEGMISLPIGIRELPVYAVRVLATAREALRIAGVAEPARHVAVIRSAWNVRVLIARQPFDEQRVQRLAAFADERSFDLSYAPGLAVQGREIWNDLPPIALESSTVEQSGDAQDAVAREAELVLAGMPPQDAFDRSPVTADRPWLSPLVRLPSLGAALDRIEILPQQEIGLLVNVAVLAQAIILALVVSLLPLAARGALRVPAAVLGRALVYFPALGLGFLLIEIAFIEHAALLLGDRTSGFALVLTTMLVFSGIGAMWAGRVAAHGQALRIAVIVAVGCALLALFGVRAGVLAALDWPWSLRAALLVVALAPISLALGFPFPLGLDRFQKEGAGLLPWAWALNGAFSVVATPLANLLGHGAGLSWLLIAGMICYSGAALAWPKERP